MSDMKTQLVLTGIKTLLRYQKGSTIGLLTYIATAVVRKSEIFTINVRTAFITINVKNVIKMIL